jgi:hypothetical protein
MENKLCIEFKNITLGYKKPGETISILKNINLSFFKLLKKDISLSQFLISNLGLCKKKNVDLFIFYKKINVVLQKPSNCFSICLGNRHHAVEKNLKT